MKEPGLMKLPPPPRQVRRRVGAIPNNGCVTIPFILVGVGFLLAIPVRLAVLNFGTPVTVVVDGKTQHANSKNNGFTYHVQFHYLFHGTVHADRQQVSGGEYSAAKMGQEFSGWAMQFVKWTVCISTVGNPNSATILFLFFGLLWNGVIVMLLFFLVWPSVIAKRLVREGTVAAGVVTGRYLMRGKSRNYYVIYDFKTSDGTAMTRKMNVGSSKMFETAVEGMAVTVLYSPGRPKRSVAYEFCGYEVMPMGG